NFGGKLNLGPRPISPGLTRNTKMGNKFLVSGLAGSKSLRGSIGVGGAKNAVLKGMAATLLFEDEVRLENVPEIEDVQRMAELLQAAGAKVVRDGSSMRVTPPTVCTYQIDKALGERMRASIVLTGPMLARCGEVSFPFPGGCVLGERPIDLFLNGFKAMGCSVAET